MGTNEAIKDVSSQLGIDPAYLIRLINFESGFNPAARNPFSGARGLIQFMPDTARSLGYASADDLVSKNPTSEMQLRGPVLKYLSQYKPFKEPFPQSLYLSVFYPKYRYSSPDTVFSEIIRAQNPGINKVQDYINYVEKKTSKVIKAVEYSALAFFVPVGTAALAVYYFTHKEETDKWIKRMVHRRE